MTATRFKLPQNFLGPAGSRFGIDLAGLFEDDSEAEGGAEGFLPSFSTKVLEKGRGGALSYKAPRTPTRESVFNLTPTTKQMVAEQPAEKPTEKPKQEAPLREAYKPDDQVRFSSNYLGNLSQQEAAGKAAQLLHRAIGAASLKGQEDFNKLFEPLYKDLQTGDDYGADISRFYKSARSIGYEPYSTKSTDIRTDLKGAAGYQPFVENLLQPSTMGQFYDPADFGRRILEAKAYYEPGGVGTNLTAIGNVQNEINRLGEDTFYGKSQAYKGGYRQGIPSTESDPFRQYYNTFIGGTNKTS